MMSDDEQKKRNEVSSNTPLSADVAIVTVLSPVIVVSCTKAVQIMKSVYAEDVRRMNKEIDEEINGRKPRRLTPMERLQIRRVVAHNKGRYEEVGQTEKRTNRKTASALLHADAGI